MAKKIVWTYIAKEDIKNIVEYWENRIGSSSYSLKLLNLTQQQLSILSEYPLSGKPTNYPNVRFIIVRDYKIFYTIMDDVIIILRYWDSRQNPDTLELK